MLNRLRLPTSRDERRTIDQYRAFCLLALGRAAEADSAIEAVVTAEPSFHPSDAEVSPRVRTAFSDVRRRMLPTIIQQKYAQAKAAFDRKEFAAAADGFSQVLGLMTEPDIASAAKQPPLSDLRTLAVGFHDLSASAAAPPPPPPPPLPAPSPPQQIQPTATPIPQLAAIPAVPRIYDANDTKVVPPTIVRQVVPPFSSRAVPSGQGMVEVIVQRAGSRWRSIAMPVSRGPRQDRARCGQQLAVPPRDFGWYSRQVSEGHPHFIQITQITGRPSQARRGDAPKGSALPVALSHQLCPGAGTHISLKIRRLARNARQLEDVQTRVRAVDDVDVAAVVHVDVVGLDRHLAALVRACADAALVGFAGDGRDVIESKRPRAKSKGIY